VTWNGERRTDGSRLFENRHGIKIVITQEGSLGKFTTVNAMVFLGGAVAIFAVASIFVDNIVIRFFVSKRVKEILELASKSTFPVRADLDRYVKTCEAHMGAYEAPTSFWEVEKEWHDQGEKDGRIKPRPDFKQTGAVELQELLNRERLQREQTGDDTKGATELQIGGALAFARTISQNGPPNAPELHRNMSSAAKAHWKLAKDGIYAQVRANQKPGLGRVATALAGRAGRQNASLEPQPDGGVVMHPAKREYVPLD